MITSRPFETDDAAACLDMLRSNTPSFFAEAELDDYRRFLSETPPHYRVYVDSGAIVGACGLRVDVEPSRGRIQWIMTDASARGRGLGGRMMCDIRNQARDLQLDVVDISASQKSAPFFSRFGAQPVGRQPEGWGPGLDRVEMVWRIIRG